MNIYSIYRATNIINEKSYIGFDSDWPSRMNGHKYYYDNPTTSKYNSKFYQAIRKYGWNNFVWNVIYQSLEYEHTLEVMEDFFINKYDSLSNGYNTIRGGTSWVGDKNPMKRQEVLEKVSGDNHYTKNSNFIETRKGSTHYHYDTTVYTWQHKITGEILNLTRFDFIRKVNAKNSNVCLLIKGKRKSASGWKII